MLCGKYSFSKHKMEKIVENSEIDEKRIVNLLWNRALQKERGTEKGLANYVFWKCILVIQSEEPSVLTVRI